MGNRMRSMYAGLASRFAHLALGASEEDEEERRRAEEEERARKAREEGDEEEDEDEEGISEDEKKGRHARNEKRREKARQAAAEKEDEDDEEEDEDSPEAKAAKTARASERARWAAVLSASEAKGRVPLACSLLADTSMSADKIRAALLASPAEARQGLAARMAGVQRPDIGSAAPVGAPDPSTPKGRADLLKAAYNKATGKSS